jgi:hypothetical protein
MEIESIGTFDESGLKLRNSDCLEDLPHIRELLIDAENLYRSDSACQHRAKRQSRCLSKLDTGESLSPLGSFLLALERAQSRA